MLYSFVVAVHSTDGGTGRLRATVGLHLGPCRSPNGREPPAAAEVCKISPPNGGLTRWMPTSGVCAVPGLDLPGCHVPARPACCRYCKVLCRSQPTQPCAHS